MAKCQILLVISLFVWGCTYKSKVVERYSSGAVKAEVYKVDGKKDGPVKIFYENGFLAQEGVWKKDYQEGLWKFYFPTGKLEAIVPFKKSKEDGTGYFYRMNGKREQILSYKNGKLHGKCYTFYSNDSLKTLSIWNNGEKVKVFLFDSLSVESNK